RTLPPHTFAVVTSMDNDSFQIGLAIEKLLIDAGWTSVPGLPMPAGIKDSPGASRQMPPPAKRGATAAVKDGASDSVRALASWFKTAGLQPGPAIAIGMPRNWPPEVLVEVGDAPHQ